VFGRGSTGGVIEQDSKLPKLQPLIAGTFTGGTDSTRRATIDINEPLAGLGEGAAFRINAMGHKAMVTDRNVVEDSRYGFAPSFSLGLGTPTRLMPVTRGVRLASFFWVQSMVRDETRRTILFNFDNALQQLGRTGADHDACVRLAGVYHNLLRQWADS
jgi:outer membrane receptor protein involved in Fe transport